MNHQHFVVAPPTRGQPRSIMQELVPAQFPYIPGLPVTHPDNLTAHVDAEDMMRMLIKEVCHPTPDARKETRDPFLLHMLDVANAIRALSKASGKHPEDVVPGIRTLFKVPCTWTDDGRTCSCNTTVDASSDPSLSHLMYHMASTCFREPTRVQCRVLYRGRMCGLYVPLKEVFSHMKEHVRAVVCYCKMCDYTAVMPSDVVNHYICGECRPMNQAILALNPKHRFVKRPAGQ
ncbi:hypothetical protein ONZ45_g9124 [Pleurotus djamor]|nr:hypothetical protein ONZ45_g9124 [Pleurotus djamor]